MITFGRIRVTKNASTILTFPSLLAISVTIFSSIIRLTSRTFHIYQKSFSVLFLFNKSTLYSATPKGRSDSTSLTKQPELSPTQKARAFRDWAESHRRGLPLLSDEAISRESIYSNEQL